MLDCVTLRSFFTVESVCCELIRDSSRQRQKKRLLRDMSTKLFMRRISSSLDYRRSLCVCVTVEISRLLVSRFSKHRWKRMRCDTIHLPAAILDVLTFSAFFSRVSSSDRRWSCTTSRRWATDSELLHHCWQGCWQMCSLEPSGNNLMNSRINDQCQHDWTPPRKGILFHVANEQSGFPANTWSICCLTARVQ